MKIRSAFFGLAVLLTGCDLEPSKGYHIDPPAYTIVKTKETNEGMKGVDVWIIVRPPVNPASVRAALDQIDLRYWNEGKRTISAWAYSDQAQADSGPPCGWSLHTEGRTPERSIEVYPDRIK